MLASEGAQRAFQKFCSYPVPARGLAQEAAVASIWPGEQTQGVARRLARLVVAVTVSGGGLILVIRGPG